MRTCSFTLALGLIVLSAPLASAQAIAPNDGGTALGDPVEYNTADEQGDNGETAFGDPVVYNTADDQGDDGTQEDLQESLPLDFASTDDPQIYQTSAGPEVQHTNELDGAAAPEAAAPRYDAPGQSGSGQGPFKCSLLRWIKKQC